MLIRRTIVMGLIAIAAAVFGGPVPSVVYGAGDVIRVGGTGTSIGVMKLLGAAYERKHPDVRIEVLPSMGTPGALKAVVDGAIGVAVAGRPLNDEEIRTGASGVEIARTPFIFVTHRKTGLDRVTSQELEDMFAGRTNAWPNGERVRLILRPARETSSLILKTMSPGMEKAVESAVMREGMIIAATDQDSAEEVIKTPGSLGTSTLTQVITEGLQLQVLALNGVTPSVDTLASGKYPLYKKLFVVTSPKSSAAGKRFTDFIRSGEAKEILKKTGNWTGPF